LRITNGILRAEGLAGIQRKMRGLRESVSELLTVRRFEGGVGDDPLFVDTDIFFVFGGNGAALGLLCAWLVDDRMAARRGEDRENDLLGVYVVAIVLVLLSLAEESANIGAAVGGGLAGSLLGLVLPVFTRKSAY
jgi:hypothetical protein